MEFFAANIKYYVITMLIRGKHLNGIGGRHFNSSKTIITIYGGMDVLKQIARGKTCAWRTHI